jgi:hypothetical protein
MGFLRRLFGGDKAAETRPESDVGLDDPQFAWFLKGWELEVQAGYTPVSELLEELPERFLEHFPFTFGPKTEERLLGGVARARDRRARERRRLDPGRLGLRRLRAAERRPGDRVLPPAGRRRRLVR